MKRFINQCIVFIICLLTFNVHAAEKISIYTTNYPLKYFAERIAGNHANVILPLPTDIDPVFWDPKIKVISQFQTADLIILNGASYEKWIHKVSLPQQNVIDTSSSFKVDLIGTERDINHSHGLKGEHIHSGTAFTTWLDFSQATQQAKSIFLALSQRYPQYNQDFQVNYDQLEEDLLTLDQELSTITNRKVNVPIMASHPVYQYLQKRYNLNIKSVFWEPDVPPNKEEWVAFQKLLESFPAEWMIWEIRPNHEIAEELLKNSIQSVEVNPCANVPVEGDFMSVMRSNVRNIGKIFN